MKVLEFQVFLVYAVAFIGLIGGIMVILRIGTQIIAVLFAAIMMGAIFMVNSQLALLGAVA